jgi:hypothetical protein
MSVLFRHERYSDWYLHRMLRGQHRQEGGMNPMENGNKLINPEEILVSLPHRIASSDPWGLSEAQLIIVLVSHNLSLSIELEVIISTVTLAIVTALSVTVPVPGY